MKKLLTNTGRKTRSAKGFTLIELLVVVVILGILAAIAIPTLLGQAGKAKDASAKSSVRSTVDSAVALRNDNTGDWASLTDSAGTVTALGVAEKAYSFGAVAAGVSPTTGPNSIGVEWITKDKVELSALSAGKKLFCAIVNSSGTITSSNVTALYNSTTTASASVASAAEYTACLPTSSTAW